MFVTGPSTILFCRRVCMRALFIPAIFFTDCGNKGVNNASFFYLLHAVFIWVDDARVVCGVLFSFRRAVGGHDCFAGSTHFTWAHYAAFRRGGLMKFLARDVCRQDRQVLEELEQRARSSARVNACCQQFVHYSCWNWNRLCLVCLSVCLSLSRSPLISLCLSVP